MTLRDEHQLVFEAKDSTEFRALLGRILATTPLSCGQIAIKTGMPRSTAYSLPDTKRPGLPSNPEQVAAFVRACGLSPTQVELVMDLWTRLQREIEDTRTSEGKEIVGPVSVSAVLRDQGFQNRVSDLTVKEMVELGCLSELDLDQAGHRYLSQIGFGGKRSFRLNVTSWPDLLQYTLAREDRTRRAVMLLTPITLLLLGVVCALVFLAVQTPAIAPFVAAGLLSPLVLLAYRSLRKPKVKVHQ